MHIRQTLVVVQFLLVAIFSLEAAFGGDLDLARQNPLLRDHFRQLVDGITPGTVEVEVANDARREAPFVEFRVDWLIEDFLARLDRKMGALKTHFDGVTKMQEELAAPGASDGQGNQIRWNRSLKGVEDEAEDLRDMLSLILPLPAKTDFKPQLHSAKNTVGFQEEVDFIRKQIAKAEHGIRDLFLAPTHTVDIQDDTGGNVLINLYRVSKMAEALRKRL